MTVSELIDALWKMSPTDEITFAHCDHAALTINSVRPSRKDGVLELVSDGWTDDCCCEETD